MVVADAGDIGEVLGHSQFTIENDIKFAHNINRGDDVSSNIKTFVDALLLFEVGVGTKPDDFCFRCV